MRSFFLSIFLITELCLKANVDLRSGNFYISFIDLESSRSANFKIERVYNAHSSYNGIFGYGWSSNFETYLSLSSNGEMLVHEYGGGAAIYYINKTFEGEYIRLLQDNIKLASSIKTKEELGKLSDRSVTSSSLENFFINYYTQNRNIFEEYWDSLVKKHLVSVANLPTGTIFKSDQDLNALLIATNEGFERYTSDGNKEFFDKQGRIVEIIFENGKEIYTMAYNEKGRISKIENLQNDSILFAYNNRGLVERIKLNNIEFCHYSYSAIDFTVVLTGSEDLKDNKYLYEYYSDGKLKSVTYSDNSRLIVSYDKRDRATEIIARNGDKTHYDYYDEKSKSDLHYKRTVKSYKADGSFIREYTGEFYYKRDQFNHLILTSSNENSQDANGGHMKMRVKQKSKITYH